MYALCALSRLELGFRLELRLVDIARHYDGYCAVVHIADICYFVGPLDHILFFVQWLTPASNR